MAEQSVNESNFVANMAELSFLWLGYFCLHSILASLKVKGWVAAHYPEQMPLYRLSYNILAVLLLLPILWLMAHNPGPVVWAWRGASVWLANGLALAAVAGFLYSLKSYDGSEFLGLRQLRSNCRQVADQERLHLSPLHRYVRHPWYFFGLVLIWTRDMNAALLLSSVMMTVYFIMGSKLEEKKLVVYYGDVYRQYMRQVPGLFPLPWKSLSEAEATELVKAAQLNPDLIKG